MLFHDHSLARRLEAAHARDGEFAVDADLVLRPGAGSARERLGGGSLLYCGPDSFLSHALGVGMDGEITDAELDHLERFYFERGAAVELDLCPFAEPSLAGRLAERGFRTDHFETVLVRELMESDLDWQPPSNADVGYRVTEVGSTSQRNLERSGFHPAYTRTVLRKPPARSRDSTSPGPPAAATSGGR